MAMVAQVRREVAIKWPRIKGLKLGTDRPICKVLRAKAVMLAWTQVEKAVDRRSEPRTGGQSIAIQMDGPGEGRDGIGNQPPQTHEVLLELVIEYVASSCYMSPGPVSLPKSSALNHSRAPSAPAHIARTPFLLQ